MAKKKKKLPPYVDVPGRPGMGIVNRYMPDASPEEKEEGYENLKQFVRVLVQIDDRLAWEKREWELLKGQADQVGA